MARWRVPRGGVPRQNGRSAGFAPQGAVGNVNECLAMRAFAFLAGCRGGRADQLPAFDAKELNAGEWRVVGGWRLCGRPVLRRTGGDCSFCRGRLQRGNLYNCLALRALALLPRRGQRGAHHLLAIGAGEFDGHQAGLTQSRCAGKYSLNRYMKKCCATSLASAPPRLQYSQRDSRR